MQHSDPLKFGFYRVGQQVIFSKVEALEQSQRVNLPVTYHFNDEIFSKQNWSQEPTQDLSTIYQLRAQQIRSQYDHIVLFYSGGADSHNMLESFVRAGVQIDEIASFHSYGGDRDRQSTTNREVFETAIPYVERLKQQGRLQSDTPHRLIDLTDVISDFSRDMDWTDFPYLANSTISINNVARADLREHVTDWRDMIQQGRRVCLVWGHDKPRIMHVDGGFVLYFMDIYDNCVSAKLQHLSLPGYFDEMFYSTSDMPELIVKQARTICRFLEKCPLDHPWITTNPTGLGHVIRQTPQGYQTRWLTQDAQSMLIYPWFDPGLYYEAKPKDILYSQRDRWFWKDPVLSHGFRSTVDSLINRWGDQWLNRRQDLVATQNYRTRHYRINLT